MSQVSRESAPSAKLLRLLDGDCNLPVGVETWLDGGQLSMSAVIFHERGKPPLRAQGDGDAKAPEALAALIFGQLYGDH